MMKWVVYILILLNCTVSASADVEIRADRSETFRRADGVLRVLVDGVSYRDSLLHTFIAADSARARFAPDSSRGLSQALFFGQVRLQETNRSIFADSLVFDPREDLAIFRGRVDVAEGGRRLRAQEVIYARPDERMEARGSVRLDFEQKGVRLLSQNLVFEARTDSGRATGRPQMLRLPDGGGDSMRVSADTLRFYDAGAHLKFDGSVEIRQGAMEGRAQSGRFDEESERLYLDGDVRIHWKEAADTVRMDASRAVFFLEDSQVRKLHLYTKVELLASGPSGKLRQVRADTCDLVLTDGRIEKLDSKGQGRASLVNVDSARTDLEGDRIEMRFRLGNVDSLELEGRANVRRISAGARELTRLEGGQISGRFQAGALEWVLARKEARCEHQDQKKGNVRLTGDWIELVFEKDELLEVRSEGGVRGSYSGEKIP